MNETLVAKVNESVVNGSALIQSVDPNWFYSAVAQSSAAIVGLMGAFLTIKLINQKSTIKNIETQITENKAKIDFLKERIKEKEEWVNAIDEEEDLKDIQKFLNEIADKIDPDNPPSIDELMKMAEESDNEKFHNLNKVMLEESYNDEFLASVRERIAQKNLPFGLGSFELPTIPTIINPQIAGMKWDRYRRYNDEINATHSEIKYLKHLIKTKENELTIERAGLDLRKTFVYLAGFSLVGVFLPLVMLTLNPETMYFWRAWVLLAVLVGWLLILVYLAREISLSKGNG